ncbi:hypothetical protein NDU88_001951 [Pleurodeles waltl]|uniref:Uncharacterized protein n=1 Tax=Pleurodeles waltl TaxID=8319 RepID=A0AAV7P899_PLEWA|nr:hypothetical protein NDU88_001951 [Pleurodeles waltl]
MRGVSAAAVAGTEAVDGRRVAATGLCARRNLSCFSFFSLPLGWAEPAVVRPGRDGYYGWQVVGGARLRTCRSSTLRHQAGVMQRAVSLVVPRSGRPTLVAKECCVAGTCVGEERFIAYGNESFSAHEHDETPALLDFFKSVRGGGGGEALGFGSQKELNENHEGSHAGLYRTYFSCSLRLS